MQVGDIVKFKTGYTGLILELTSYNGVSILIMGDDLDWLARNPTHMSVGMLSRCAEVVSGIEANT